jgi:hypothetical protein
MDKLAHLDQGVMQVCRHGHVITGLLQVVPGQGLSHCDRCGAETLDRCPTCGQGLAGSAYVPGLVPIGRLRPPAYCSGCGARLPWTKVPATAPAAEVLPRLEAVLRRLPRAARQLRSRHADRPPFRLVDDYDLEDLLRAVLALEFDDVRPERRTPTYAAGVRTDWRLPPADSGPALMLTAKRITPALTERALAGQLEEDVAYYERHGADGILVVYLYDPEGLLPEPAGLEARWSRQHGDLEVRCVLAT